MYQLPGSVLSPRRKGPSPLFLLIATALVAALLAPLAIVVLGEALEPTTTRAQRISEESRTTSISKSPVQNDSISEGQEDHAALHLAHLIDKHRKMSASIRRAQDLVRIVAPSLDRNFMQQQKRRLESADFYMESVRREIEESLEELEMMTDLEKE